MIMIIGVFLEVSRIRISDLTYIMHYLYQLS